jgi:two-component system, OmpR family, response regulator
MSGALKVLFVDDDDDIRSIGELALVEVGGMPTVLASSGSMALEVAAREQPDVVLLDVMMPGMDGPTTLRRLREQPATAAIPVVFVTAQVRPHEVQRYLELGAIGVIGKPFEPMTLPDELRALVARSRERG